MTDTLHETINKELGWLEEDFYRFQIEQKKATAQAETLNAIGRYFKATKGERKTRLKGIAQGMLYLCEQLNYFTKKEIETFEKLIDR